MINDEVSKVKTDVHALSDQAAKDDSQSQVSCDQDNKGLS